MGIKDLAVILPAASIEATATILLPVPEALVWNLILPSSPADKTSIFATRLPLFANNN